MKSQHIFCLYYRTHRILAFVIMAKHLVFVYGACKRGQPNYDIMFGPKSDGSFEFQGVGKTVDKYALVIATRYNMPIMLSKKGIGKVSKLFQSTLYLIPYIF